MSFIDEMNDIGNANVGLKRIDEPCVEIVEIKSYKLVTPDNDKNPYIEIVFETQESDTNKRRISTDRLYRVRSTDDPSVAEFKNKRIKELLMNAGADFSQNGEDVLKSAVGKKVKALFKGTDKIRFDKNNYNKPYIFTNVEYSFSVPANKVLEGRETYLFKKLSDAELQNFDIQVAKWEQDYGDNGTTTPEVGAKEPQPSPNNGNDDDLPF